MQVSMEVLMFSTDVRRDLQQRLSRVDSSKPADNSTTAAISGTESDLNKSGVVSRRYQSRFQSNKILNRPFALW